MKLTRRQFLVTTIGGAAVIAACGGDDGGGSDASTGERNCATNGTSATISANHGHTIMVTASDITAGQDKTYNIQGTSDHAHMVTVTAANFSTLQSNANGSVMVTSTSGGGHTHSVTIVCA
jgi:hypothetical protein